MIYLLWGLLSISIFIFFILICFRATKLLREKFGLLSSLVFVFGLLSFMGSSGNMKGQPQNKLEAGESIPEDNLKGIDVSSVLVDLEKTVISRYILIIEYGNDRTDENAKPISAYSIVNGVNIGTNWKPQSVVINQTPDSLGFEYRMMGLVEWDLLGATLYSQLKEYKGIVRLK